MSLTFFQFLRSCKNTLGNLLQTYLSDGNRYYFHRNYCKNQHVCRRKIKIDINFLNRKSYYLLCIFNLTNYFHIDISFTYMYLSLKIFVAIQKRYKDRLRHTQLQSIKLVWTWHPLHRIFWTILKKETELFQKYFYK